ncbi:MAG: hypothetical protein ACE5O2_05370 [Armatimonadota bacterium]
MPATLECPKCGTSLTRQKIKYDESLEALEVVFEQPPVGAPGGKRVIHGEVCPACGYVELHTAPWMLEEPE